MDGVRLSPATLEDSDVFLAAVERSRDLHGEWVQPPADAVAYGAYVTIGGNAMHDHSLVWHDGEIAGVVNLSQILRGRLQQAFIGFYACAPLAGRGLMTQAVRLGVRRAFDELGLHRLEANVQPHNSRSLALVERAGFHREGFSPRYLFIAGKWRDHERWAVVSGDAPPPGISF